MQRSEKSGKTAENRSGFEAESNSANPRRDLRRDEKQGAGVINLKLNSGGIAK